MYAYTRNNPLKFTDPSGTDVTITAKTEDEAKKKFEVFQRGLSEKDRQHVKLVVGDGKDGYEKGEFYIKVDKDYKSESGNFQAIQQAANDRTALGKITVLNPGDSYSVGVPSIENQKTVMGEAQKVTFQGEFAVYTLFEYRGGEEIEGYSAGAYTEILIRNDKDDVELAATMHHELRAHLVLGDFGRNIPKARHSDPYARGQGPPTSEADKIGEAAEKEARQNAKKKP